MAAIVNTVKETLGMETTAAPVPSSSTSTAAAVAQPPADGHLAEDVEPDNGDEDSAYGGDGRSLYSDTTSVTSTIYQGYMENGRRYQTLREGEYWGPSDPKQFESMNAAHLMAIVIESRQENPLFRSPIGDNPQNILDIGTGNGPWAVDVADRYPSAHVRGVDLFPVPNTWVPPNCTFEVDDVLKTWMYAERFDLIHIRWMIGSFTDKQWRLVYKQCYDNLVPGGWIEHWEPKIGFYCDDGTLPEDSILAGWANTFIPFMDASGKKATTSDTMKEKIIASGFTNVQEKLYKVPMGTWARNPLLKEAGKYNEMQFLQGMEGYVMHILTKFGQPKPWSVEEVQIFLAKARQELENGWHTYWYFRRVWAQKPVDADEAVERATPSAEKA